MGSLAIQLSEVPTALIAGSGSDTYLKPGLMEGATDSYYYYEEEEGEGVTTTTTGDSSTGYASDRILQVRFALWADALLEIIRKSSKKICSPQKYFHSLALSPQLVTQCLLTGIVNVYPLNDYNSKNM